MSRTTGKKNKGCDMETAVSYHGIIIDKSQNDKTIFSKLVIKGRKRILMGLVVLYRIEVEEREIDDVVTSLQKNMSTRFGLKKQQYYAHFYRADELMIVFKDKIFRVKPDPSSWTEAVKYGLSIGIPPKQLDFIPNRFEDERY